MLLSLVNVTALPRKQVSTNSGPRSAAWFLKFLADNFPLFCFNVAIAQLIECFAGETENPGLIPGKGEIFFI